MIHDKYVWLIWSSAFLVPWLALLLQFRQHRKVMLWASVITMPFGLTEPIFVPRYWNPPSLFDLAQRTGFDVESLIFCFAIGGVCAVLYNIITGQNLKPIELDERAQTRHRYHRALLLVPAMAFPVLYMLPWNPIYPAIAAMVFGGAATVACRSDLKLLRRFHVTASMDGAGLHRTSMESSGSVGVHASRHSSGRASVRFCFRHLLEWDFRALDVAGSGDLAHGSGQLEGQCA